MKKLVGQKIDRGVRSSISQLIRYFTITLGFIFVLSVIGIEMTEMVIIFGALGVGMGFGLQGIVNNFVSGLILLFERPLREGDIIEVNDKRAYIKRIGLRATVAMTFKEAEVIIPNAELISNQVINWTLSNNEERVAIPISVAYGSDIQLVIDILKSCAKTEPLVISKPEPSVMFVSMGDSALLFELRVWINQADAEVAVRSNIYVEIDKQFKLHNIVIPFPQMVLHKAP